MLTQEMVQVLSTTNPLEKVQVCKRHNDIVCKVQFTDGGETQWFFDHECVDWYPRMTPTRKVSATLTSISSLCQEGTYSYSLKQWKRFFITRDRIVIVLLEDVPESGGSLSVFNFSSF
jgi:hypothetical protein